MTVAQDAIIPDLNKAPWQDMHAKSPQKLYSWQSCRLYSTLIPIVLVMEAHTPIIDVQDSVIADGHPVGILSQIFDDLFRV